MTAAQLAAQAVAVSIVSGDGYGKAYYLLKDLRTALERESERTAGPVLAARQRFDAAVTARKAELRPLREAERHLLRELARWESSNRRLPVNEEDEWLLRARAEDIVDAREIEAERHGGSAGNREANIRAEMEHLYEHHTH